MKAYSINNKLLGVGFPPDSSENSTPDSDAVLPDTPDNDSSVPPRKILAH